MDDVDKTLQSRELYDLAETVLSPYAGPAGVVRRLVYDLSEVVEAYQELRSLAAELSPRLAESGSAEGRIQLLAVLVWIKSLMQLEICKHGESFTHLCDVIEEALRDRIVADGLDEHDLSLRLATMSERRYRRPQEEQEE